MWPAPIVPIRVGFFYNPSAEGHDRSEPNYRADDFFGITAGVGLNDEHVHSNIGAFYVWSSGAANENRTISGETVVAKGLMLSTAYVF
jgi:hypothetical protein